MKIWLDDQLDDPEAPRRHTPEGWVGCRNDKEFKAAVTHAVASGETIEEIRFDNDLGEESLEGNELLEWLKDTYPEVIVAEGVEITAHSENGPERENMRKKIAWWRKHKDDLLAAKNRPDPWAAFRK
jgi:hypothetical protein